MLYQVYDVIIQDHDINKLQMEMECVKCQMELFHRTVQLCCLAVHNASCPGLVRGKPARDWAAMPVLSSILL